MVIRRPSLLYDSTLLGTDLRPVLKTPMSFSGTSLERLDFSGIRSNPLNSFQHTEIWNRLRGHRDQITAMRFLSTPSHAASTSTDSSSVDFLVTSSKDTLVKLWELSTQHCVQTVVAHPSEVWTLDINPSQELIFTGGGEGELKAWRIDHEALSSGLKETDSGQVLFES